MSKNVTGISGKNITCTSGTTLVCTPPSVKISSDAWDKLSYFEPCQDEVYYHQKDIETIKYMYGVFEEPKKPKMIMYYNEKSGISVLVKGKAKAIVKLAEQDTFDLEYAALYLVLKLNGIRAKYIWWKPKVISEESSIYYSYSNLDNYIWYWFCRKYLSTYHVNTKDINKIFKQIYSAEDPEKEFLYWIVESKCGYSKKDIKNLIKHAKCSEKEDSCGITDWIFGHRKGVK